MAQATGLLPSACLSRRGWCCGHRSWMALGEPRGLGSSAGTTMIPGSDDKVVSGSCCKFTAGWAGTLPGTCWGRSPSGNRAGDTQEGSTASGWKSHVPLLLRVIGRDELGAWGVSSHYAAGQQSRGAGHLPLGGPIAQGESETRAVSRSGCPGIVETPPQSLSTPRGHIRGGPTATLSTEQLPWRVAWAVPAFLFL